MACTTILVGKKASYDGSTMIARNDDSPSGRFTPKKYVVVHPDEQPRKYISVLSHVEIDLPDNPMRYTAVPNALEGDGIWAASGVNEANVAMTATETITSIQEYLVQTRSLFISRPEMDRKRLKAVSVRKILYAWSCLIFAVPVKGLSASAACLNSTALMK